MLHGVRAIKKSKNRIVAINNSKKSSGSVSVEAAISLSVFMLFIFSLAYILKVFYTYNTVQQSLTEVSRNMANLSYFYHLTGAKDFSDRLNEMAEEAETRLEEQKNTIVNAYTSFTGFFSSDNPSVDDLIEATVSVDDLIDSISNTDAEKEDGLMAGLISGAKEELKLFITIIARKLNYEVTNKLVCLMAKHSLKGELSERTKNKDDPALALGIRDGMKGLDFSKSSVFGDSESLEFVVNYTVEPFAFLPALPMSNRVKVIGWTGGRGSSVKESKEPVDSDETGNTSQSYWNQYDDGKMYFDRGLKMEEEYVKTLNPGRGNRFLEFEKQTGIPAIDAYVYNNETGAVEYYDVFTLNPFLKTYSTRPSSITSEIKKHGKRLLECGTPGNLKDKDISKVRRIVVMIVPDNSGEEVDNSFRNAKETLEKYGVEVILYRGFGSYEANDEDLDSAA
ncbi:MAG: hypothetical protein GX184_04585 [Clostridiaceae bacterium]|nr:hypothetical protein [Clostridiaceae bacterium]